MIAVDNGSFVVVSTSYSDNANFTAPTQFKADDPPRNNPSNRNK
eukprot:gene14813-17512_t